VSLLLDLSASLGSRLRGNDSKTFFRLKISGFNCPNKRTFQPKLTHKNKINFMADIELILGGQKSGKSAQAERLACAWLAQSSAHRGVFVATAQAWDEEMRVRIRRHQEDRAKTLGLMRTIEEPLALAQVLRQESDAQTLIVIDCITLWLVNLMMPMQTPATQLPSVAQATQELCLALEETESRVILVSNEIGLGVIPMGKETRDYVDALGLLNQALARSADRVTLMTAGIALPLKT
jgi:adenosylcobinamide kinase/adenosylcobinamide-phosphate guanylyltransferase